MGHLKSYHASEAFVIKVFTESSVSVYIQNCYHEVGLTALLPVSCLSVAEFTNSVSRFQCLSW